MTTLAVNTIPEDFGKEQLQFLTRIKDYETKNEITRFLLITSFGGILSIIAGFIEFVFYKFYNTDVIFFQFNFSSNPEPVLLLAVWILTIFPFIIILIFTIGTPGLINWNRTYRNIGYIAITLFLLSEITVLAIGENFIHFVPLIWGSYILLGFILAGLLMYKLEKQPFVERILILLGVLAFINSFVAYLFLDPNLVMFYMLTSYGVVMIVSACIMYFLEVKYSIFKRFTANDR